MAFIDGEQIPDDRILDIFRPPPGVPTVYERNTLIVGSRGVGKTTLFRYLKSRHAGLAIHLALASELAAFGKEAALGPLAQNLSPEIENLIGLKASALLAISFGERLSAKRLDLSGEAIAECLPTTLLTPPNKLTSTWCRQTRLSVSRAEIEKFAVIPGVHTLRTFLEYCGDCSCSLYGRLLLLLDRADMVVPSSLKSVMALLDQSRSYTALVAMRPGHATGWLQFTEVDPSVGDHSNIVYLGKAPYSTHWQDFILDAIKAQLGDHCFDGIAPATLQHLLIMSRESLRNALELAMAISLRESQVSPDIALTAGVEAVKDNLLLAVQQVLQRYKMDFGRFLTDIRKEIAPRTEDLHGCVRLSLRPTPVQDLFAPNDQLDNFIGSCLRARAFCIADGQVWAPTVRVTEVEIPAIYLWKDGDPFLELDHLQQYRVSRRASEVFAVGGPIARKKTVFVAYRMDIPCSQTFRSDIERTICTLPFQYDITITDGKVLPGVDWAPEIRDRIKKSNILIGDVTGLRNDVIFEIGFAYGLRKVFIPVLETTTNLNTIPQWLTTKQCASYECV